MIEGLIEHPFPQGTEEWIEARRGVITASRAKDVRDFKKNGDPGSARLAYAMDLARERCGGKAPSAYVNAAMRTGIEEEQFAAIEYMARTGAEVSEAVFVTTPDRKFGMSVDRWAGAGAALEIKTMVSSATLFKAMVDGDISDYRDQCVFGLWLFRLDWIDLCLWAPDLPNPLHVVRIERDEDEIQKLEDDLMTFERLVVTFEARLRAKLEMPETRQSQAKPSHSAEEIAVHHCTSMQLYGQSWMRVGVSEGGEAYTEPVDAREVFLDATPSLTAELLEHIGRAFRNRFPSQPKVSQEWWQDLRAKADALRAATQPITEPA
jgi:exodeoxyribonuclease (lambda-induced)